jgi:hypothetical protein
MFPDDTTNQIQKFAQKFAQLKSDLDAGIEKQRDFVSLRTIQKNESIGLLISAWILALLTCCYLQRGNRPCKNYSQ